MSAGFIAPLGFLALASLAAIVFLHMRRQVPETRRISSLRFWTPASRDDLERSRLRRPPFSWMLLLQLLAALALTLSLARPFTDGLLGMFAGRSDPRHEIVILDGSTSMQANIDLDSDRTRFAVARGHVVDTLNDWQPGDITTLLIVGTRTQTFSASNQQQADGLRQKVSRMAPPGGRADMSSALRLAGDLLLPNRTNQITVITDAAVSIDPAIVSGIVAPITLDRIGGDVTTTNDAITAISSRIDSSQRNQLRVSFTIAHFSDEAATVPYTVTAGGTEIVSDAITLGPDESRQLDFAVSADAEAVVISIPLRDVLLGDNSATLHLERDALSQLGVMLVSDNPGSLQRALDVIPGTRVDLFPSATSGIAALSASYDLAVFDGVTPLAEDLPSIPMLFLQPQPLEGSFGIQGVIAVPSIDRVDSGSAVLEGVDLAGVTFTMLPAYTLTPNDTELVGGLSADGTRGPLIWQGMLNDKPYLALAFNEASSNIARRVAFPILVARAVSTLTTDQIPAAIALGDALVYRPSADATELAIDMPNSRTITLTPSVDDATSRDRVVTFTDTSFPGTYGVRELASDGSTIRQGSFVVNAGQIQESNLRPNSELESILSASQESSVAGAGASQRTEIWTLLVAIAIILVLAEWILALRGSRRRSRGSAIPDTNAATGVTP